MRGKVLLSGLMALATGTFMAAAPAIADEPVQFDTKVLLTQRVQSLPDGPLCFNLTQQTMPAGQRVPAQGYRADPLGVAFMLTGQARLDYAGGPSMTVGTGEGMFIGADNWYAVTNTGTAPDTAIVYSLSCQPAPAGIPGVTQLGNSGPLAGVRSGTPYDLVFVEVKGVPGSVIAAHTHPSTEAAYILEGSLALSRPAGVTVFKPGDLAITPAGMQHQAVMAGPGVGRLLSVYLTAPGASIRDWTPDAKLPTSTTPAALPRTGESVSWLGGFTALMGALLVAAGLRMKPRAS